MEAELGLLAMRGIVGLAVVLSGAFFVLWADRKGGDLLHRQGGTSKSPVRGLAQPFFDTLKLLTRNNRVAETKNPIVVLCVPLLALIVAFSVFVVIPVGGADTENGLRGLAVISHVDTGLLYILAMLSLFAFPGIAAGWSSRSSFPLLAAFRVCTLSVSFALVTSFSIIGVVMVTGSFELNQIVEQQTGLWLGVLPRWNVFTQPIAAITCSIAAMVTTGRRPFDLSSAGEELVEGYQSGYWGVGVAGFRLSAAILLVSFSAVITVLFFGGWTLPGVTMPASILGTALSLAVFACKAIACIGVSLLVGWASPRPNVVSLAALAWKVLLPLSALSLFFTGFMMVQGWV